MVFGPHRLAIPAGVVAAHPAFERYLGEPIVLGIRPEHLQDAAITGVSGSVIRLPVRLREELGSEVQVHGAIGTAAHVER